MYLAPVGAFGGMAYTIGKFGLATLIPLGKLMLSVYLTMFLFVFIVLGGILRYYKIKILDLLKYIREEILLVLGTSSSESALPSIMLKLEKLGCSKSVVGLVIPTGYSWIKTYCCGEILKYRFLYFKIIHKCKIPLSTFSNYYYLKS